MPSCVYAMHYILCYVLIIICHVLYDIYMLYYVYAMYTHICTIYCMLCYVLYTMYYAECRVNNYTLHSSTSICLSDKKLQKQLEPEGRKKYQGNDSHQGPSIFKNWPVMNYIMEKSWFSEEIKTKYLCDISNHFTNLQKQSFSYMFRRIEPINKLTNTLILLKWVRQ